MNTPRSSLSVGLLPSLLCAAALVTSSASAQVSQVTLYENAFFGGTAVPISFLGIPQNVPIPLSIFGFNDQATSLHWDLEPNVRVVLADGSDGRGDQFVIASSAPRIGQSLNVGPALNDSFSSILWQIDDQSAQGVVTVYEDPGLGGSSLRLPLSSYAEGVVHPLPGGFEDRVSSLNWDLKPNEVVTFYENVNGTGREFTVTHDESRAATVNLLSGLFHDRFSSFRWDVVDPSEGWVELYTGPSLSGARLTRYVSELGFGSFGLGVYDNEADSVAWNLPTGTTVWLRDSGACLSLTEVSAGLNLANSAVWHDSISRLEIQRGDLCADGSDRNRPYDQNAYVSANNAHASDANGWNAVWYQDLSVFSQLEYGVRTLRVKTLLHTDGQIYMVNGSFAGTIAQRGSTPDRLITFLTQVRIWLDANPREVVTLIFDHQGGDELGVELTQSGPIRDFIHFQNDGSWPTLNDLIASGRRVVVFENGSGPASAALNQQLDYNVINGELSFGQVTPRPDSESIDDTRRSLFYMNNISPLPPSVWPVGSAFNLFAVINNLKAQFSQLPNYIGADRITEAGGSVADVVRATNLADWSMVGAGGVRAKFASFGPESCGERRLRATTRPIAGSTLTLEITSDAPAAIGTGGLSIGLSDQIFGGVIALPFDIGGPGTSCLVRTSADLTVPFVGGGHLAPYTITLALPSAPVLVGFDLFMQTADFDGVQLALSTLGRAHIGER